MSTVKRDILLEQGIDFSYTFTAYNGAGTLMDLTGFTVRGAISQKFGYGAILSFTAAIGTPNSAGQVTISLTSAQTLNLALPFAPLSLNTNTIVAVYDVEVVSAGGVVTRVQRGGIKFSPRAQ